MHVPYSGHSAPLRITPLLLAPFSRHLAISPSPFFSLSRPLAVLAGGPLRILAPPAGCALLPVALAAFVPTACLIACLVAWLTWLALPIALLITLEVAVVLASVVLASAVVVALHSRVLRHDVRGGFGGVAGSGVCRRGTRGLLGLIAVFR